MSGVIGRCRVRSSSGLGMSDLADRMIRAMAAVPRETYLRMSDMKPMLVAALKEAEKERSPEGSPTAIGLGAFYLLRVLETD